MKGIVALLQAGRLWYTKRVPTLHGGGSFCSPYERSDSVDIFISPIATWAQQTTHSSGTLALFSKSSQARPCHWRDAEPLLMETLVSHTEPFHSD